MSVSNKHLRCHCIKLRHLQPSAALMEKWPVYDTLGEVPSSKASVRKEASELHVNTEQLLLLTVVARSSVGGDSPAVAALGGINVLGNVSDGLERGSLTLGKNDLGDGVNRGVDPVSRCLYEQHCN